MKWAVAVAALGLVAQAAVVTIVPTPPIARPDGSLANGTVNIQSQAFINAAGTFIPAVSILNRSVVNGIFVPAVSLESNIGATPSGTSYRVTYTLTGSPVQQYQWYIPAGVSTILLSAVQFPIPGLVGTTAIVSPTQLTQAGATTNQAMCWLGSYWGPGSCGGGGGGSGTVTSVGDLSPLFTTATATTTPTFSLISQSQNLFFASPNGSSGVASFRAIAVADVPTLNQNTTGSAGSFTGLLAGDVTGTQGANVVGKINGVALSGLATGILKNTTAAGTPSIAVAADFPTLNQNTTGTASALAANPANCAAGTFPLGINASGTAENCTALPTTLTGTANQITVSAATGAITISIPSSPTLPGTTTGTFSGNLTGNVTGNTSGTAATITGLLILANTPMTTKGDLMVNNGTTLHRLAVGSNTQVLTADSTQTDGVKWAAAGTGDVVGPASALDNAFMRSDGTTGKLIQGSTASLLDDSGNATFLSVGTGASPPSLTPGTGGSFALGEGTVPSVGAASAVDVCYADSTAHTVKCSLNNGSYYPLTQTIASGTSALGTSSVASQACATVVTTTATGALSTDSIIVTPNASIKAVTGFVALTTGGMTVTGYATANAVNWDACNWSTGSITPGAVTLNWRITR